jgi:NAD(P)H-nitrite reductase large subunit
MKHVVVGNGIAGMSAAQVIRKNRPDDDIMVISGSPYPHYYRPKVIHYLAGDLPLEKITTYKPDYYAKNSIETILNCEIVAVDPAHKVVTDSKGRSHHYDKLLLATGGDPFVPPISGVEKGGVFTVRGITSADTIISHCSDKKNIVVVGGGLLGLETANSIRRPGMTVTVIELAQWLLHRQLDEAGGTLLKSMLTDRGLDIVLNDSVSSIDGGDSVERVTLKSGRVIEADCVVISAGIRPSIKLARSAGCSVEKGVLVNDAMETSVPDIYAAGDAAEHGGMIYGLWQAAMEQGKCAGMNMSGVSDAYQGTTVSCELKVTGIDLFSYGDIYHGDVEGFTDIGSDGYKKITVQDGKVVSVIVLGDQKAIPVARKVSSGKGEIRDFIDLIKK